LKASLRCSVPAGDTGAETERTIDVSCGHQGAALPPRIIRGGSASYDTGFRTSRCRAA
jgi:hypothetical protein